MFDASKLLSLVLGGGEQVVEVFGRADPTTLTLVTSGAGLCRVDTQEAAEIPEGSRWLGWVFEETQ